MRAATGLIAEAIAKDGAQALIDNAIDNLPRQAA
jgi:hypothetical protein